MEATLTFSDRSHAEAFAVAWGRHSKMGHTMGAGLSNVTVAIWNVTEADKKWIDNYIASLTPTPSPTLSQLNKEST